VFKLPPVVQVVPLKASVAPVVGVRPPNARPAVCVPQPAKLYLDVPKFPLAVQVVPLNFSVAAV